MSDCSIKEYPWFIVVSFGTTRISLLNKDVLSFYLNRVVDYPTEFIYHFTIATIVTHLTLSFLPIFCVSLTWSVDKSSKSQKPSAFNVDPYVFKMIQRFYFIKIWNLNTMLSGGIFAHDSQHFLKDLNYSACSKI